MQSPSDVDFHGVYLEARLWYLTRCRYCREQAQTKSTVLIQTRGSKSANDHETRERAEDESPTSRKLNMHRKDGLIARIPLSK